MPPPGEGVAPGLPGDRVCWQPRGASPSAAGPSWVCAGAGRETESGPGVTVLFPPARPQVVARLCSSCADMAEEEVAKLGVSLFNCQASAEGRRTYPCTAGMVRGPAGAAGSRPSLGLHGGGGARCTPALCPVLPSPLAPCRCPPRDSSLPLLCAPALYRNPARPPLPQSLAACTAGMDPDTWNAYHIVSNRARAVCYATRQLQFRRRTEQTVNALVSTAAGQLEAMRMLKVGVPART